MIFELLWLATEYPYLEQASLQESGQTIAKASDAKRYAAIAYLAADRDGYLWNIDGLERVSQMPLIERVYISKKLGSKVCEPKESFDRIASFIAVADDPDSALHAAREAVEGCSVVVKDQELPTSKIIIDYI